MAINLPSSEWTAPVRTGQVCRKHSDFHAYNWGSHVITLDTATRSEYCPGQDSSRLESRG